jgi:hypothetical protein
MKGKLFSILRFIFMPFLVVAVALFFLVFSGSVEEEDDDC